MATDQNILQWEDPEGDIVAAIFQLQEVVSGLLPGDTKNEGQAIAKARDQFFKDNPGLLKCAADGQYLKNRLEKAFIAGWHAGRKD